MRLGKTLPWLCAGLLLGVAPARGGDAMQELIEALHDNGTLDDAAYQRLKAVAAEEAPRDKVEAEPVDEAHPPGSVSLDGGLLKFESPGGDYKFQVGGRIQIDAAAYDQDQQELGNGSELRRARIFLAGQINRIWAFKSEFDFASSEIAIQDVYISYTGLPWSITFGHFKEPISLENLTSDKYITFMERALLDAFTPGRNIGLGLHNGGETWSAAVGVFGNGFDESNSTEDPVTDASNDADEGYGATGRLTWAPFGGGTRVLHLGAAASFREFDQSQSLRYRSRPESHITDVRLVDTGAIAMVDGRELYGLEFAAVVGPWSAQSEYLLAEADQPGGGLDFGGWYVQTAYVLTGESRNYKPSSGEFGRFKPAHPVGDGGWGAWQLAARLSEIDLNDGPITGGEERNLTLGLNWFLEPTLRFAFNYVQVLEVDGGADDGAEPSAYQLRTYIDF